MVESAHPPRLILASASPRRRELLSQAGFTFKVEAADIDESRNPNEEAGAYVLRLANEKARVIFARHSTEAILVLGADTCVVCEGETLNKPVDARDAMRMLRMLSGRKHLVLTGVAVASHGGTVSDVESTEVTFAEIPEPELTAYCATPEPLDKAGAYGIQGCAARWIPRIDGCYFNVMGLPIARTVQLLNEVSKLPSGKDLAPRSMA